MRAVGSFTEGMQDEKTQSVLDKAAVRRRERATDIRPWVVTDYPDAFVKSHDPKPKSEAAVREGEIVDNGQGMDLDSRDEDDVAVVLKAFKEKHASIHTDWDESTGVMLVGLPAPASLHFKITRTLDARQRPSYEVICTGKAKLHGAITRSINLQKEACNLARLLVGTPHLSSRISAEKSQEMLAAYRDIKSRLCASCQSLLAQKVQLPTIRKRVTQINTEGNPEPAWEAYHETCI